MSIQDVKSKDKFLSTLFPDYVSNKKDDADSGPTSRKYTNSFDSSTKGDWLGLGILNQPEVPHVDEKPITSHAVREKLSWVYDSAVSDLEDEELNLVLPSSGNTTENELTSREGDSNSLKQPEQEEDQEEHTPTRKSVKKDHVTFSSRVSVMDLEPSMSNSDNMLQASLSDDKSEPAHEHAEPSNNSSRLLMVEQTDNLILKIKMKELQLENERLLNLLEKMMAASNTEKEIMRNSQGKILEIQESYQAELETRLKQAKDEMKIHYEGELQFMKQHADEIQSLHKSEIAALKSEYEKKLRDMQSTQKETMDMIKEQHRYVIENMREGMISDVAATSSEAITKMTSTVIKLLNDFSESRSETEKAVAEREKDLKLMEKQFNENKTYIMDVIRNLEIKLEATVNESNQQNFKICEEMHRILKGHEYIAAESERMRKHFSDEENRLEKLKLANLQEIQASQKELQNARQTWLNEQIQIENEHQTLLSQNPLQAESVLKLAMTTLEKIKYESELLTRKKIEMDNFIVILRNKESRIEKCEEEWEKKMDSAKKMMEEARAIKNEAIQDGKTYKVLAEELIIRSNLLNVTQSNLQSRYESMSGRCWWCTLMNAPKLNIPEVDNAALLRELDVGSIKKIGDLTTLKSIGWPFVKPPPFDMKTNLPVDNCEIVESFSDPKQQADTVDNLLDTKVRRALKNQRS